MEFENLPPELSAVVPVFRSIVRAERREDVQDEVQALEERQLMQLVLLGTLLKEMASRVTGFAGGMLMKRQLSQLLGTMPDMQHPTPSAAPTMPGLPPINPEVMDRIAAELLGTVVDIDEDDHDSRYEG
jgi:hypothetical protein